MKKEYFTYLLTLAFILFLTLSILYITGNLTTVN